MKEYTSWQKMFTNQTLVCKLSAAATASPTHLPTAQPTAGPTFGALRAVIRGGTLRVARRAPFAPWSVRRALLTPQVNPGSRYRCGKST